MSDDLSGKTVLVRGHGLDIPLARKLSQSFGRVLYFADWEEGFSSIKKFSIGNGFPDIERCEDLWHAKKDVDLFLYPDIGHSGEQLELESQGYRVWGSRLGDELELDRELFLGVLSDLGLEVPKYEVVVGLERLGDVLKDREDCYVKISRFRGDMETTHWRSWDLDEWVYHGWEVKFGPAGTTMRFLLFDPIDTPLEIGGDTYCVDGQWPSLMLHGIEWKDQGYFSFVTKRDEMPDAIKDTLDAFGPVLKQYRYRNQWSMELRVKDDKAYFIDPTCFSDDTDVLTMNGWKRFKDLCSNDLVCTLNPETREIQYQHPTRYVSYHYDGEMISISSAKKTLDLLVTPNHSVWSVKQSGKLVEERADSLHGIGVIPRTGTWIGEERSTFTIPEYRHRWKSGKGKGMWKEKVESRKEINMDVWLRFLAIFLSEGHARRWQTVISQVKYKDEVRTVLSELGFGFTEQSCGFTINSVQLSTFLKNTGTREARDIPRWIHGCSPRQIRLFLDFYILGDGRIRGGDRAITTTSIKTADSLQELFLLAGSVADVVVIKKAGSPVKISGGKYTTKHDSIEIRERLVKRSYYYEGWNISRHHRNLKRVSYKGMVYDVEVPNHIIFVRRNGRACFSGNCRLGLPSTSSQMEVWGNLPEIFWHGSMGELIEPEPLAKFTAEAAVCMKVDKGHWGITEVPDELKDWLKLSSCCEVDGRICFPPDDSHGEEIGWLVALGDTPQETIETLKAYAAMLPDGVTAKTDSLVDIIKEIDKEEAEGIKFTGQTMPDPAIVIEDA